MGRGQASKPGDTRWSPNGYHYTRTEKKWELTHKLLAEEALGRTLEPQERCRFKDGDRTNVAADNIEVYVAKEKSAKRKLAELYNKRDELDALIADIESEIE